jgi:hypothetical protein
MCTGWQIVHGRRSGPGCAFRELLAAFRMWADTETWPRALGSVVNHKRYWRYDECVVAGIAK